MKVSQKEKLHCTALPGGPTGNILIAKLDWIERIGAPRRSVGLRMWSNRCKFHHANQPWRVERKGRRARGRRKGSNPSLPLLSPSFNSDFPLSARQKSGRVVSRPPGLECASGTFSTPPPSRPLPGRDAEVRSHKSERARLKAEGCRLPNRCLDPVENRARSEISGFHP